MTLTNFPRETSKIIRLASEKRENADYLDFYVASKDEAEAQIFMRGKWTNVFWGYLIGENSGYFSATLI